MKNYEQHPLAAQYGPKEDSGGTERITESMRKYGYDTRYPIFLYEGKVLVGWTRAQVAKSLKLEPAVEEYDGDEPIAFMLRSEADRRHLSVVARLNMAEKSRPALEEEARQRMAAGTLAPKDARVGKVSEAVADAAGVSPRTAERFRTVKKHGTRELQEAVEEEEVTVTDAANMAKEPADVQKKAVKAVKSGKSRTVSGAHDANGRPLKTKKPRKKPEPKKELKDKVGKVIPNSCRDAFADPTLGELIEELEQVQSALSDGVWLRRAGKLVPTYPFLLLSEFGSHASDAKDAIDSAIECLRAGVPHAVCPKCHGEDRGTQCRTCRGCGHVPETRYAELANADSV